MPDRLDAPLTDVWLIVALVGVATIALKGAGPVALGGRELPSALSAILFLLAPALLAALVVTQAVGGERELVLDERLLGLGAAAVAIVLRAPLIAVVLVAAATTALARAVG
jgi:branched-subunit amino acid transport protein